MPLISLTLILSTLDCRNRVIGALEKAAFNGRVSPTMGTSRQTSLSFPAETMVAAKMKDGSAVTEHDWIVALEKEMTKVDTFVQAQMKEILAAGVALEAQCAPRGGDGPSDVRCFFGEPTEDEDRPI